MTTTKEGYEMLTDLGTKGYEAAHGLGEINLRAIERMVARQMDAMSMVMEGGLRQMKMVTDAKGYNDLVKGQVEFVREISERVLSESRENVKLAGDTRDEYRAWFEKGVQSVSDKMSKIRSAA